MAIHDDLESGLALAVRKAGSQVAFGALIGRRQSTIQTWLSNHKELPAEYVLQVERLLGISRHELRPDLYPIEDTVPPAQHPAGQPSASAPCPPSSAEAGGSFAQGSLPGVAA